VLDWVAALASSNRTRPLRVHWAAAAAAIICIIAMTALFAVMPRTESDDFTSTATGGLPAAYLQVFYVYLGTAMAVAAVLFWRASRLAPGGTVRWGFWLLATVTSVGACYAVYLLLRVLGTISTTDASILLGYGANIENVTILLILAGLSVPAFGVAWQNACDLAALRALHGMWRDLVAAVPGVTVGSWRNLVAGSAGAPRILLIRRIAEIRDAALALRCDVPSGLAVDARNRLSCHGLSGVSLDAATEACWLKLAIRARLAGAPGDHPTHVLPGGETLAEEVRWLRQVAAASRSKPVRAVTTQVADGSLSYQEAAIR
jgi:hypothetical protein